MGSNYKELCTTFYATTYMCSCWFTYKSGAVDDNSQKSNSFLLLRCWLQQLSYATWKMSFPAKFFSTIFHSHIYSSCAVSKQWMCYLCLKGRELPSPLTRAFYSGFYQDMTKKSRGCFNAFITFVPNSKIWMRDMACIIKVFWLRVLKNRKNC